MFRQRLSATARWGQPVPPLLLLCRHQTYSPSAWSACTSASLSRYFHCTLKETLQRAKMGDASAADPDAASPSAATPCGVRGMKLDTHVTTDVPAVTTATSTAHNTKRSSSLSSSSSLSQLQYSLELSLPHLPHRTPLTHTTHSAAAGMCSDVLNDPARKEDLLQLLLPSLPVQSGEATSNASLQPRWTAFVQLCDSIVAAAASRTATPAAASAALPSGLMGITIPCKEPYFSTEDERAAAGGAAPLSTIQAAIWLLHQHWHVPVTLALNTTAANRADAKGVLRDGSGASEEGVAAVMNDFVLKLGGRHVLLVRGDSPSTQHGTALTAEDASTASVLRTSADLVRCVRACIRTFPPATASDTTASVELAVAGYPQGHPLDRTWGVSPVAATTAAGAAAVPESEKGRFFSDFERDFNHADSLFDQVVKSPVKASAAAPSTTQLPALRNLFRTLGRLHAVRHLWLTPSTYTAEARAASARQLVEDKVLLRDTDGQRADPQDGGCGARVVVTQMLTSAREFTQFTEDVQRALQEAAATTSSSSSSSSPATVKVIPGLLLPHPTDAHILLRSLYYAKVIPSARLQRALETYRTDLKCVWRSIVTHNHTTHDDDDAAAAATRTPVVSHTQDVADGYRSTWPGLVVLASEADVAAVEAFVKDAHRRAGARFAAAWMADTVDLLCELQQPQQQYPYHHHHHRGGTAPAKMPVHFFTMFNDQVDVRLAQLLDAYAARQGQQRASSCM